MDLAHLALALYSSKVQSNEMLSSWSKGRRFPIQWCHRSILQSIHDLPSRSGCNTPPLRDSGPLQPQYTRAASLGWMQKSLQQAPWHMAVYHGVWTSPRSNERSEHWFFHILSRRRLYVQIYGLIPYKPSLQPPPLRLFHPSVWDRPTQLEQQPQRHGTAVIHGGNFALGMWSPKKRVGNKLLINQLPTKRDK